MDTIWMAEGNCAHEKPTVFFPSDGVGVEVARRICATCPVKEPCLEYALEQRIDHGVWAAVPSANGDASSNGVATSPRWRPADPTGLRRGDEPGGANYFLSSASAPLAPLVPFLNSFWA